MARNTSRRMAPALTEAAPAAHVEAARFSRTAIRAPEGTVLRHEHIDPVGQRLLDTAHRDLGLVASGTPANEASLLAKSLDRDLSERSRVKSADRLSASRSMHAAGAFSDVPMTLESAAHHRVDLVQAGMARSRSEGVGSGADWYFQHHRKLRDVAQSTGLDTRRVITASAVMSPQNNPDQELKAVTALARAHVDPKARITMSRAAADLLSKPDDEGNVAMVNANDYVGRSVHPSKFGAHDLAAVSGAGVRHLMKTTGDVDLLGISAGGSKGQIAKSIRVLRGDVDRETAIDPHSSPKVWSYERNIAQAEHGSGEHEEFMRRVDLATNPAHPEHHGQQSMDLFGLRDSQHGILSTQNDTAEDSWMQAIDTRQQLAGVNTGRGGRAAIQSPAKFSVGEGGVANPKKLRNTLTVRVKGRRGESEETIVTGATPQMLRHAWGNKATRMAAEKIGSVTGTPMPATATQAVAWTEVRRQAGGNRDLEYEDTKRLEAGTHFVSQFGKTAGKVIPKKPQSKTSQLFHGADLRVNPKALPVGDPNQRMLALEVPIVSRPAAEKKAKAPKAPKAAAPAPETLF